jgi:hypothetical protein
MFGIFGNNKLKKIEKEYETVMAKATDIQRSGDLKAYAKLIEKSEAILKAIEEEKQK